MGTAQVRQSDADQRISARARAVRIAHAVNQNDGKYAHKNCRMSLGILLSLPPGPH
jgi:hypothetical protein